MPDAPDFYQYSLSGDRDVLNDDAELAARLRSVVNFNRRGQVIKIWDGSRGLSDIAVVTDTAGTVTLVNTIARESGYAARLAPFNAGAVDNCYLATLFDPQVVNKWGLEVSFCLLTEFEYLRFYIRRSDGTTNHEFRVKYTRSTNVWSVRQNDGNEHTFATRSLVVSSSGIWINTKLVVDMVTEKFVYFLIGEDYYDLSAYDIWEYASASVEFDIGQFNFASRTNNADICHVSHIIDTTGEF